MKISELIHKLHQMQVLHGDIEVGHEIGSDEFPFEYIDDVRPVYPRHKDWNEDKTRPADCIELR